MEINKLTYEEALSKLEDLLVDLEDEDCTLKDSVDKFKLGMELYNHLNEILKKTEGEVKIILGEDKETLREIDFIREAGDGYC
ncbi:exodeoxyribonuclease VII small subunit [Tissierella creatinini]|nr:exodeoxyribonuclease VII small subunit [Tissierella creatinini]TJX69097.1 exodeoxyribonuclease VII small subunit [Soehngenia saccharolytica]